MNYSPLPHRHVYAISGKDRAQLLQGLITNDIRKVDKGEMVFAAMLTPQGKFFADFFIYPSDEAYLLEVDLSLAEALIKKLNIYKLRADVEIAKCPDKQVIALWSDAKIDSPEHTFPDPRHAGMGWRAITTINDTTARNMTERNAEAYNHHRLTLGIPDGAYDASDRSLILDLGYELLNAVDYQKGCYVGQEVTARMHYRDVKRKGIMKIMSVGDVSLPEKGEPVFADEITIGDMASSQGCIGLAMVKFDALEKAKAEKTSLKTKTGEVLITPPVWR